MSFLGSVNLFPDTRLWRIRGQSDVRSTFGGIMSLVLIVAVVAILTWKMVQVFKRQTITVIEENIIDPTSINPLSTFQNDSQSRPVMMAIIQNTDYVISGVYIDNEVETSFQLEQCTTQHFSTIDDFEDIFTRFNMQQFKCLPLNQEFQVGGNVFSQDFRQVSVTAYCNTSLSKKCLASSTKVVILYQNANPSDNDNSWSTYMSHHIYESSSLVRSFKHSLIRNTIQTQYSILPFVSQKDISNGYQLEPAIDQGQNDMAALVGFQLLLSVSEKTKCYKKSFLTILDALSYIGGIFNSLLAAFFFMNAYGKIFFQMFFANIYFKAQEATNFGFFSFIKQSVYSMLTMLKCKPNWQYVEERNKLIETVNNLTSIIYLQQRIQFLEKAVSLTLEPHHLKGLHLIHGVSPKEADDNYKGHGFRDRLISYFKRKQYRNKENLKNIRSASRIKYHQAQSEVQKDTLQVIESAQSIYKNGHQKGNPILNRVQRLKQINTKKNVSEVVQKRSSKHQDIVKEEGGQLSIQQEYRLTIQMEQEFENDLRALLMEAECSQGDQRSRKIVARLDKQMMQYLKQGLSQDQSQRRYMYSIPQTGLDS